MRAAADRGAEQDRQHRQRAGRGDGEDAGEDSEEKFEHRGTREGVTRMVRG